jgi:FkbM family methyltransferase
MSIKNKINLGVTYEDNMLRVQNLESFEIKNIWMVIIDINSNLVKDLIWCSFPPNSYILQQISEIGPNCSGYRIEAFFDDEQKETQFSTEIVWGEIDKKYSFENSLRELNYSPFVDLFYKDEYNGKIVITEDDVVYDLGANVGVFTMWALKSNAKQIYAFEPTNYLIPYLCKTFSNEDNRITIYGKAITGRNEIKQFNMGRHSVSNSLYTNSGNPETIDVQCINLEQFINENNLQQPTLMKVDIEGSEYEMFDSLSNDFIQSVKTWIVEFHYNYENKAENIIHRLLDLGFNIEMKKDNILKNHEHKCMGTFIAKK